MKNERTPRMLRDCELDAPFERETRKSPLGRIDVSDDDAENWSQVGIWLLIASFIVLYLVGLF